MCTHKWHFKAQNTFCFKLKEFKNCSVPQLVVSRYSYTYHLYLYIKNSYRVIKYSTTGTRGYNGTGMMCSMGARVKVAMG